MVLQPAVADSRWSSEKVTENIEFGAMVREPVTSVATKVLPASPSVALVVPPVDKAADDDGATMGEFDEAAELPAAEADELAASGVALLPLAQAVRPIIVAATVTAAGRLSLRIVIVTKTRALILPPLWASVSCRELSIMPGFCPVRRKRLIGRGLLTA